jgi:N4-gp56 family major capsid protein
MQIYYDKRFLRNAIPNLHMMQFAQKRGLPLGAGKQIQFFRYNDIAVTTTKLTEGTNPTATAIAGHNVNRTLEEWGGWSQHSSLISKTHIDRGLAGLADLWGDQAGRSIDLRIMKEVVTLGSHSISAKTAEAGTACGAGMRGGQWACSENGTTASTTGILYAQTAVNTGDLVFDDTDNWFIGGLLTGTSGANYGQSRYVYDSSTGDNSMHVYPAWETAPSANDTFIFSHPGKSGTDAATANAIAATDVLTHKVFAHTREDLQTYRAPAFAGNYYVFLIGPTTNAGFMTDTDGGSATRCSGGRLANTWDSV